MTRTFGWCIILAVGGSLAAQDKKEPAYKKTPLSEWLKQLEAPEAKTRREAALAIREIGPPAKAAVPVLTKMLKATEGYEREAAAFGLAGIGPDAKSALPAL